MVGGLGRGLWGLGETSKFFWYKRGAFSLSRRNRNWSLLRVGIWVLRRVVEDREDSSFGKMGFGVGGGRV